MTLILYGWKFWAVVIADVGANLAGNLVIQYVKKIPLGFRFDRQDAAEFLRFGLPLLGSGILIFAIFSMGNFMVSTTMGIAQLGYYALAMNWGSFICGLLGSTVNSVLFPTFAAIQEDSVKMRRWYLKTVDLVALIAVIANTSLLANAHSFLVIFLGKDTDKWVPAEIVLQVFCFYGIIRAVTEPIASCLMARNRTKTLLHATMLCGGMQVVLLVPAIFSRKIEWVAVALLISYSSQAIIYVPYLRRELSITFADPRQTAVAGGTGHAGGMGGPPISYLPKRAVHCSLLAYHGLFTAVVVAVIYEIRTGFRCLGEVRELILLKNGTSASSKDRPSVSLPHL